MPQDLRGSAIEAFWTGTSFLLNKTAFQLTFWSSSETFGRKHLVILSPVLFTVGSTVAVVSKNFCYSICRAKCSGLCWWRYHQLSQEHHCRSRTFTRARDIVCFSKRRMDYWISYRSSNRWWFRGGCFLDLDSLYQYSYPLHWIAYSSHS